MATWMSPPLASCPAPFRALVGTRHKAPDPKKATNTTFRQRNMFFMTSPRLQESGKGGHSAFLALCTFRITRGKHGRHPSFDLRCLGREHPKPCTERRRGDDERQAPP